MIEKVVGQECCLKAPLEVSQIWYCRFGHTGADYPDNY